MSGRRAQSFAFRLILKSTAVQFLNFFAACHFTSTSSSLFHCLSSGYISISKRFFDPFMIPIRSCQRIDDELVSNYGLSLRKSVTFNDLVESFGDVVTLEPSPATSKSCPITFIERYAMPLQLAATQPQRNQPRVKPQRKNLRVRFSPFYLTIEPCGRTYPSVTALEEESGYWKPGAFDGEPFYKMNCQIGLFLICACCFITILTLYLIILFLCLPLSLHFTVPNLIHSCAHCFRKKLEGINLN